MIIYDMKTEDLINPIGIDEKKPRFSWKLQSKISGTVQTAYRIIVRSDNDTVWDSGKVTSDRSICIEYDGRSLSAMTKYSWQVSVWDEQGNEYTSDTADFETGLMNNEFNADWIGRFRTQEIKITMSYLTSAKTAFLFTKYPTMLGMTMFLIKNYSVHSTLPNIPTALNYR